MEHSYESTTVEMDHSGFASLQDQLLNPKQEVSSDIREKSKLERSATENEKTPRSSNKKFVLSRGDDKFELDDDYEIEFMADKKPTKLTLRELKERAAGDIAIKNRMHSLAEEKKRVSSTFKEFTTLAKRDPLAALEYISNKAKETDSDFEYAKYIEKLAEQAEKLGQMDEQQRKTYELEKKLAKTEENLSQQERQQAVVLRKQEMLSTYPEIGDSQFGQMVDAVLKNDDFLDEFSNESDVMDRVEELIQETLTQRDIMTVIRDINPKYMNDNELIFSLSDQLRQNPDLDEEDVRDIVRELIAPEERIQRPISDQRQKDVRTLSSKARQAAPMSSIKRQNAEPFDILKEQLMSRKKEIQKTPLYKR
jgi:hypothetical protein